MKLRPRRSPGILRLGPCALGVLILAISIRPVQAQQVSLSFAQGTHLFRRILHDSALVPLRNFNQLQAEPADTLLIVLGEADSLGDRLGKLDDFVEQGGAVLLATDRTCEQVLRPFGVAVVGARVRVSPSSLYAYKGLPDCVFVQPSGKNSPLFEDLSIENKTSRVATNRPGYLRRDKNCSLKLLATFPPDAQLGRSGRSRDEVIPFAMGWNRGAGRMVVLSDHSVFINAMMWQPDIENFDFAYNCVNWLTEKGKRTRVLFLEEGKIQETFDIPVKEPPLPPIPPLKTFVEAVDKGLGELESDNVFNDAIHKAVTGLTAPWDQWQRSVVWIATSFLGLFALARLSQARHRQEKLAPLAISSVGRTPSPSLLDQRHQSMEQEGNYWEAARALARQGFELAFAVPSPGRPQPPADGFSLPPLTLRGRWWQNRRLRRRLQKLWKLAYGTEPVRISSGQLKRLGSEIETMKVVLARSNLPPSLPPSGRP